MPAATEPPINVHKCRDDWNTPYANADVYCCMCGEALINLSVEPEELFLLLGDAANTDRLKLRLNNTKSIRSVHLSLQSTHPAIEFSPLRNQQVKIDIPGGEVFELELCVNINTVGDSIDGVRGDVEIRVLGTFLAPLKIPLRIGHAPEFKCEIKPLATLPSGARLSASAKLRQTAGMPTQLREATFAHPAFSQTGLFPGQRFAKSSEAPFQITIDGSQTVQYGKQVGKLILKFDVGPTYAFSIPVEFEEPPKLRISHSAQTQIPQGVISDLSLFLRNEGGGVIEIESLKPPKNAEWFRFTFMETLDDDGSKQISPLEFPLLIPASKQITVTCEVDAEGLPEGSCVVEIIAIDKQKQPQPHPIRLQIDRASAFEHFVAIDFGTTNSCVSYWDEKAQTAEMVSFVNPEGKEEVIVPSVAFYDREKKRWLAGFDAVKSARVSGKTDLLVRSVKRLLNEGKGQDDQLQKRKVEVGDQKFEPEEVAKEIFRYLKRQTERFLSKMNPRARLKCNIDDVMLTLPANFTDMGVQAVLQAARGAGLKPFQNDNADRWHEFRMDEPSAAAIDAAACKSDEGGSQKLVLIFDFGGGTLDVSVLRVTLQTERRQIAVLAQKGRNWLGGDDFTAALMTLIADRFRLKTGKELHYDIEALRQGGAWYQMDENEQNDVRHNLWFLWEASDKAKVELTTAKSATIRIQLTVAGRSHNFDTTISIEEFEHCVQGLVADSLQVLDLAVKRSGEDLSYIDEIVATGKTSLIPLVRKRLAEHFDGKKELDTYESFDVKLCVARGACRYAFHNIETAGRVGIATLECTGLHEFTNSSYGIDGKAGLGAASQQIFQTLIPEGTRIGNEYGDTEARYE